MCIRDRAGRLPVSKLETDDWLRLTRAPSCPCVRSRSLRSVASLLVICSPIVLYRHRLSPPIISRLDNWSKDLRVTIAVTILPILFGRSQGRNVNGLLGVPVSYTHLTLPTILRV